MAQSKDRQIMTQSQLKMAQEWSQSCGYCLELKDLIALSIVLVDYCENGYTKELGERLDKVQQYLHEQYRGS